MLKATPQPRFKDKPKCDKYAGLLPCYDYLPTDREIEYRDYIPTAKNMEPQYVNNPIIAPEPKELKEAPPLVKPEPVKKKRKNSIEGENLHDITDNIIKDKPPLKLVIKAFKKVAESLQDQYDDALFDF